MNKEVLIHIHNEILPSHLKRQNFAICDNKDEPLGYYAKWNTSDVERQILYDFNSQVEYKNQTNKQKINEETKANKNT